MSDSSQTQLFYRPENNWGEDPAVHSPQQALREFRFVSESLNFNATTASSDEIRSDRQVADVIRTLVEAGGDVGIELSFGAFDDLFEGAFMSDWSAEVDSHTASPGAAFSVGSPLDTMTIASPEQGAAAILDALTVGCWFEVTLSAVSPDNNGFYRVETNSGAGSITFSPAFNAVESGAFRVRQSCITNGVTEKSFLIEKEFADVGEFFSFSGMRVGTAGVNIVPGAILTGNFAFQGETATVQSASIINGLVSPQTVPVAANDVFNSVDNIGNVLIDGVADPNVCFTEVSFEIDNALRPQPCIGQVENNDIGIGRITVTGTLQAYFVNKDFYEKYINFDTVSLSFTVTLGSDTYLFDFPSFKFTTGEVVAAGNDQDVVANMTFTAKRDTTHDFTIGMNRFGTIPPLTV